MKVLNLRCAHDHRFEGWFTSDDDLRDQLDHGRLACPLCADTDITRLPSAPHVLASGARGSRVMPLHEAAPKDAPRQAMAPVAADAAPALPNTLQAAWIKQVRQVLANTADVGERFASEARRMHYGEAEERAIRGRATPDEVRSLVDEGIEIVALPVPEVLKNTLQ